MRSNSLSFQQIIKRGQMSHGYKVKDDVYHRSQGPQGRMSFEKRPVYTVVQLMPIEADGRVRYRIKSEADKIERVVSEDQLSSCQ
jgi:hypothetical protein